MSKEQPVPAKKKYTKKEVSALLSEIAENVVTSDKNYLHSMLALDHIMRLPNAAELIDKDLKQQARDLWVKVKASGLQLEDPPLLFGVPPLEDEAEGGLMPTKPKGKAKKPAAKKKPAAEKES